MAFYVHNRGGTLPVSANGIAFNIAADTNSSVHANLAGNSDVQVYANGRHLQTFSSSTYRVGNTQVVGDAPLPISRYSKARAKCQRIYNNVKAGVAKVGNSVKTVGNLLYTGIHGTLKATGAISGKVIEKTGQAIELTGPVAERSAQCLRGFVAPVLQQAGNLAEQYPGGFGALVSTVSMYALYQVLSPGPYCADPMNCQVSLYTPPSLPTCPAECQTCF